MCPGHPFARESENNVAVLEFGRHCVQKEISHPKERHPRDPEKVEVSSGRRREVPELIYDGDESVSTQPHKSSQSGKRKARSYYFALVKAVAENFKIEIIGSSQNHIREHLTSSSHYLQCLVPVIKPGSIWNKLFPSCRSLSKIRSSPRFVQRQRCLFLSNERRMRSEI
jgi:hypothetical protein